MTPRLPRASCEITVAFYDVDSMDVVWHGHYVKYLERARCALLEHIGYDYRAMKTGGHAWPVIRLSLRYARPARFGQVLAVEARMVEWEYRLVIDYDIVARDSGETLSSGSTTQIAVDLATGETCLGAPDILADRLRSCGYL